MSKIKKTNFNALMIMIIIVALIFIISFVFISTSKTYAMDDENIERYFIGQETPSNLSNVIKNNSPSATAPVMTVLTHGLGESAYAWSGSDGKFGYKDDSLIEEIAGDRNAKNTIVFWAGVKEKSSNTCNFFLKELKEDNYLTDKNIYFNNQTKLSLDDVSKHIILVFEGSQDENSLQGNDAAYSELRHIINKTLYDLIFWGAKSPRINLIGHGRGGILNLMYAAEYKYNVASVYSIGTPYNGASTLGLMQTALSGTGEDSSIINKYINSDGVNDMLTFASQNLANWNNVREYVDLHALGSVMPVDFLKDMSDVLSEVLDLFDAIDTVESTQELITLAKENERILGMLAREINHMVNLLDMAERINKAYSIVDIFAIMAEYKEDLNNHYVEDLDDMVHSTVHNLTYYIPDDTLLTSIEKIGLILLFQENGYKPEEMMLGDIISIFAQIISLNDVYNEFSDMFTDITYELYYGYTKGDENNKNTIPIVSTDFFSKLLEMMGDTLTINEVCSDEQGNQVNFMKEDIFNAGGVDFTKLKGLVISLASDIKEFLTDNTLSALNGVLQFLDVAAHVPGSQIVLTILIDCLYQFIVKPILFVANIIDSDPYSTKKKIGDKAVIMLNTEIMRKNLLEGTSFLDRIQLWNDDFIWLNDGFVNSSSQIAINFDGIKRKLFLDESSNFDKYKPSLLELPIPISHNFQTRNQEIVNYIVEDIEKNLGKAIFVDRYRILDDERAELVKISGATKAQSSVVIPNSYEGREIVAVCSNAFATSVGSNITSITLPNSIKSIGYRAFAGNDSLLTVNLPTSLETIDKGAFDDCCLLQNITIPASTYYLAENLFVGCTSLNITVTSGNLDFKAQDNILYNNDFSRIIFAGNVDTSIILSNLVTTIDNLAFYKSHVQSINLANTLTIGNSAFKESSLTTITGGDSLLAVGMDAFQSTPWLNAIHTNGMAVIGNTLIKYKGNLNDITTELFPLDVTTIGSGAFYGSDISSIRLPDTITRIGEYAFSYCTNLTEIVFSEFINFIGGYAFRCSTSLYNVKFYGLNTPTIGINAFDENDRDRIISVPFGSENNYKSYQTLTKYSTRIVPLSITINYISNGEHLSSSSVSYYETLTNMPTPAIEGYTFGGWYISDAPNETVGYQNGNVCLLRDDDNLFARWTTITYTISYELNGGSNENNPASYTTETETIILETPTREGYTFNGWYYNSEYTGSVVTSVEMGSTGNKTYFAKWTANTYTLTYDINGGEALNPNTKAVTYATAVESLPSPARAGYTFLYWMDLSGSVYDANLIYSVDGNLTIIAQWQVITYTIIYTLNGGSIEINPASYTIETNTIIFLNPLRTGYTFGGWFDNATFAGLAIESIEKGTTIGNKMYFAKWTENVYAVALNKNAVDAVLDEINVNVTYASAFTFPIPTRSGYEFEGWYTTAIGGVCYALETGVGTKNWNIVGNTTLYAKWRIKIYTIQLSNGSASKYFGANGISEAVQTLTFGQTFNLNNFLNEILSSDFINDSVNFWFKKGYKINGMIFSNGTSFGWTGDTVPDLGSSEDAISIYINWVKEQHTIYLYDGTTLNQTITASYGDPISINTITKTGYTLAKWYVFTGTVFDSEVQISKTFDYTTMPDCTPFLLNDSSYICIQTDWVANIYTMTFNARGGTVNPTSKIATYDSVFYNPLDPLPTPTRTGYNFACWMENQDGTGAIYNNILGDIYTIAGNSTIYAQWTPINYSVTYTLNDGTNGSNPTSYNIETPTFNLVNPTRAGATFGGWYITSNFSGSATASIVKGTTGNKSFYAKWILITYNISYTLNGGTNNSSNPSNYTIANDDITFADSTRGGYTFAGWFGNANFTSSAITSIAKGSTTGNKTFYAKWNPITYIISYNLNGGTNSTSNPSSYNIESNNITLVNPTKKYYKFVGWYGNSAFTGSKITVINKGSVDNKSFYAKWTGTTSTNTTNVVNLVNIVTVSSSNLSIVIGTEVEEVTFIGSSSTTNYSGISIDITARSTPLSIRFVKISMTGKANRHLLNAVNCPNLKVDIEGTVVLNGGVVTTGTITEEDVAALAVLFFLTLTLYKNVFNEACANVHPAVIKAVALSITSEYDANANLSINGGSGSGQTTDISMGNSGGNGIITSGDLNVSVKKIIIKGGDGAEGKKKETPATPDAPAKAGKGNYGTIGYTGVDGLTGGMGGFGGLGIGVAGNLTISSGTTLISTGGNGGKGGQGGTGGTGGKGGAGGDGVFLGATAKAGGKGGKGGNGGQGGTGGAAGDNYVLGSIVGTATLTKGANGVGGKGGAAGTGGEGGVGGKKTTGGYANGGLPGDPGKAGLDGVTFSG
ncbi:MAG: InlB B-repeat-containing protein [Christensenellaceae bacterium]|jgi:uncharacterized repeat protein (TIGR02543 family)|nr:InlB B-repeat-containing protein [Christensenellaceae bacterium]